MKAMNLLFSLLLPATFANAFECNQREAQFIGTVKAVVDIVPIDPWMATCKWTLSFDHYSSSQICPLDIDEALQAQIERQNEDCLAEPGTPVSGILVEKNGAFWLE